MGTRTTAKLLAVSSVAIFGASFINAVPVKADALNLVPLEISPVCSNQQTNQMIWNVANKNDVQVNVNWTNGSLSGSVAAAPKTGNDPASNKLFATGYQEARTVFTDQSNTSPVVKNDELKGNTCSDDQLKQAGAGQAVACEDGSDASKLDADIELVDNDVAGAAIETKSGLPVCNDVTVYFSSYTMPDNYTGGNFYDPASHATPQEEYAEAHYTLHAGQEKGALFYVELPDACKNVQVDLYYAPEITQVGPNGHGTQNILSQVYQKDATCQAGQGGNTVTGGSTTGSATQTSQTVTAASASKTVSNASATKPAELADTGMNSLLPSLLATALIAGAVFTNLPVLRTIRQKLTQN